MSTAAVLKLVGYDTSVATGGAVALAIGRIFRPQLILLDLAMPNRDGYATGTRIRAAPWGRDATLIAVTGWNREEDRRRSRMAGFSTTW